MTESQSSDMSSSRPYLLRALHEWIIDNGATPQILVDSSHEDLNVPDKLRDQEKIVLKISPGAVRDLEIDNEYVSFVARFSGASFGILVPIEAILAIYARENGQGMLFPDTDAEVPAPGDSPSSEGPGKKKRGAQKKPDLKVIK